MKIETNNPGVLQKLGMSTMVNIYIFYFIIVNIKWCMLTSVQYLLLCLLKVFCSSLTRHCVVTIGAIIISLMFQ